jgi:hypothetical protein
MAGKTVGVILAWAVILFTVAAAVCGIAGNGGLMASEMLKNAPPETTGLPETEYAAVGQMTADYLTGRTEVFQHTFSDGHGAVYQCFQPHEAEHMADCRKLIRLAAALEGVLYSTRAMGQTILNSLGAFVEDEFPRTEGEAHRAEDESEREAAPVEEDPALQEEPVKTDREETVSPPLTDEAGITGDDTDAQEATGTTVEAEEEPISGVLPGGSIVINMEGRTEDGSMPYIILKNQLDRMR